MKKIKIIEGFGLPGAGKSTCIQELKQDARLSESITICLRKEGTLKFFQDLNSSSIKKSGVVAELYTTVSYLILRPRFFLSAIKSMFIFKFNRNFLSVLRSLIIEMNGRSRISIKQRQNECIVLDEGLIQYLGSLVVSSPTSKPLPKKMITHVLSNYIQGMIYFDVDYNEAIERIKIRNDGKSRFDSMNAEKALLNLEKMEKTFLVCIEIAKTLRIPVLKLKSGNSVDENITLALDFLNNYLLEGKCN